MRSSTEKTLKEIKMRLVLALIVSLAIAACSPNTRQVKFYLLQATNKTEQQAIGTPPAKPLTIGLGPVEIPAYLDRPQIVTGGEGAELTMAEYHRWAEPLKDTITRVLAEDLALAMPGNHLLTFPWNRAISPDVQLEIKITRFQVDANGLCELKANWTILKQNKPVAMNAFQTRTTATSNDYADKVAAQSQALAKFGNEMAAGLRALTETQ